MPANECVGLADALTVSPPVAITPLCSTTSTISRSTFYPFSKQLALLVITYKMSQKGGAQMLKETLGAFRQSHVAFPDTSQALPQVCLAVSSLHLCSRGDRLHFVMTQPNFHSSTFRKNNYLQQYPTRNYPSSSAKHSQYMEPPINSQPSIVSLVHQPASNANHCNIANSTSTNQNTPHQ